MRQTKEQRAFDKLIESTYYKHCAGTTISIMDIGKLFNEVKQDVASGKDLDASVIAAIAKYNQQKAG